MEPPPTASLPWRAPATWLRLGALAVAYYLAARVGLLFALSDSVASPVWPPAGLAVATAVLWGRRALPAVLVGAFLVEWTAGVPAGWSLLMAAGNTAEAAAAAFLITRIGGAAALRTLSGVFRSAGAAFVGPLAAASAGAMALMGAGDVAVGEAPTVWWTWYLGDVAGILIVAPLVLLLAQGDWRWPRRNEVFEGLAALGLIACGGWLVFGPLALAVMAFVVAPVVWIAARLGPRLGMVTVLLLDGIAVAATATGLGPFVRGSPNLSFLLLQAFMLTLSVLTLAVAAIMEERHRSTRDLERRVAERTTALTAVNRTLVTRDEQRRRDQLALEEAQRVAQMGTWHWDVSKPHAEWSAELYRIYGLDPATHVPTYEDYLTRVHPDDVERVKAATEAVFRDQKPYSHDERIRRADGTWRHLHTWGHAVTDASGKVTALAGACQDVTDRVSQETKFRDLLESAPDAMIIADATGHIVLVNAGAERLFGYTRAELLGKTIDLLVPEALRANHVRHRADYHANAQHRPMGSGLDLHARRKDGTLVDVEISLSPLKTPDGTFVSTAIRDITERKKAQKALEESLERFRALSEASPIGIVHTTAAGIVDYANGRWKQITGVEDVSDQEAMRRAVHPVDQPVMAKLWRACVAEGRDFEGEMRFVHADGSVRLTFARAVPVRDQAGKVTGFVSAVEDITDKRAAEEARRKEEETLREVRRLQEQADFKTNFLRTAAHELGTPLTPIRIQLSILRRLIQGDDQAKALGILERNLDRLNLLVKDLLESARLQSGRMRLNPRPMDLSHAVHEVVETFQEPAIQTGIVLDTRGDAELPIVADPDRVTQVLYNLLSNAMKFTPPGGHVTVETSGEGNHVRILVRDTGQGFTAQQAALLFQPFSQLHDPMQRTRGGSGLGLYICKGIIEQHGGAIEAHSDGPGKGATFRVLLPREAVAATAAPVPQAVERSGLGLQARRDGQSHTLG